jgi:hypothetical protein
MGKKYLQTSQAPTLKKQEKILEKHKAQAEPLSLTTLSLGTV